PVKIEDSLRVGSGLDTIIFGVIDNAGAITGWNTINSSAPGVRPDLKEAPLAIKNLKVDGTINQWMGFDAGTIYSSYSPLKIIPAGGAGVDGQEGIVRIGGNDIAKKYNFQVTGYADILGAANISGGPLKLIGPISQSIIFTTAANNGVSKGSISPYVNYLSVNSGATRALQLVGDTAIYLQSPSGTISVIAAKLDLEAPISTDISIDGVDQPVNIDDNLKVNGSVKANSIGAFTISEGNLRPLLAGAAAPSLNGVTPGQALNCPVGTSVVSCGFTCLKTNGNPPEECTNGDITLLAMVPKSNPQSCTLGFKNTTASTRWVRLYAVCFNPNPTP
ncbi:MAG: hypothetical protein WCX95_04970, partial [Candidatus Gracilibacteria bacterium]